MLDRVEDLDFDGTVYQKNFFGFLKLLPLRRIEELVHIDTRHHFLKLFLQTVWISHRCGNKLSKVIFHPPVEIVVNVVVVVNKNK